MFARQYHFTITVEYSRNHFFSKSQSAIYDIVVHTISIAEFNDDFTVNIPSLVCLNCTCTIVVFIPSELSPPKLNISYFLSNQTILCLHFVHYSNGSFAHFIVTSLVKILIG